MTLAVVPSSVRIANQWLKAQTPVTDVVDTRISYRLEGVYPAIRLTDVGVIERGPEEELRRIQVECWAEKYFVAEDLANVIVSLVPTARGQWSAGYCGGGAVVAGPFANPDPNSQRFRHQLDVGLWVYPHP